MVSCPGKHNPLRSSHELDDFSDTFHISQGPDSNSVTVFRKNKTEENFDWFQVYDIVTIQDLRNLPRMTITFENLRTEYNQEFWEPSFNQNGQEIEIIYISEMMRAKSPPIDVLASQDEDVVAGLCCKLFSREPYTSLKYQLNKSAFIHWKAKKRSFRVEFNYSRRYNAEIRKQEMYPCYGEQAESTIEWQKDPYRDLYRISSGGRPRSFFVYSLIPGDESPRTYQVHEFVENVDIESVESVKIKPETALEEIQRTIGAIATHSKNKKSMAEEKENPDTSAISLPMPEKRKRKVWQKKEPVEIKQKTKRGELRQTTSPEQPVKIKQEPSQRELRKRNRTTTPTSLVQPTLLVQPPWVSVGA